MSPKRNPSRMPCLTQRVDAPARRRPGVRLGGADLARPSARCSSEERLARRGLVGARARGESDSIVRCRSLTRATRRQRAARTPSSWRGSSPATPVVGDTIGSRNTSSHRPMAAIANFTGMGFDSMKLTCISGSSCWCHRRAVAKSPRSALSTICAISAGIDVRRHRDQPAAADRHQRQRNRVVTRQHDEVRRHAAADFRPSA